MTPPTANQIAADLRRRIETGEYRPGDLLPRIRDLAAELGVDPDRVRAAYLALREERLVEPRRGRGTVVLDPAGRQRLRRSTIRRDSRGYYLDAGDQRWDLLHHSGVHRGPVPLDIAAVLGVPAGSEAVIRDRVLGLPRRPSEGRSHAVPLQVSTSYLPAWLAEELPVVAEQHTGPGGIYDRIEEHYQVPLEWSLITTAELATAELARRLSIPRHSAVLRQLRVTALPDGRVVEVLDQRVRGDRYEVHHPLPRARSAAWPVTPATAPTPPTTSDHDTPGDMSPDAGDTGQAP